MDKFDKNDFKQTFVRYLLARGGIPHAQVEALAEDLVTLVDGYLKRIKYQIKKE